MLMGVDMTGVLADGRATLRSVNTSRTADPIEPADAAEPHPDAGDDAGDDAVEVLAWYRNPVNLVTVVVNNASYGNVLRDQKRMFDGRHSGSVLTNPDFVAYAKSFGVGAWRVEDAAGLRRALGEAIASNAPAMIEVVSDITKDYPPFEFHAPKRK